jgi:uncharacterized Zn finger protein
LEFFRHCPECGRRFHVKLESKKLVSVERKNWGHSPDTTNTAGNLGQLSAPFVLHEGQTVVIDEKEFQYTFRCGHCGHEWTEKRVETRKESGTLGRP